MLALDHLVREQHRQHADDAEDDVDEEREVVGADDAEAVRVAVPEEADAIAGPDEADEAEAGDRHPLAGLAERLGEHRGRRRQRDDDDRNDARRIQSLWSLRLPRFAVRGSAVRNARLSATLPSREPRIADRGTGPFRREAVGRVDSLDRAFRTDGSIGCRNTTGKTPMTIAIATVGTIERPLARRQVGQRAVLVVRDRP